MLITCEKINFGYDDVVILNNVCFTVNENDKIGLVGGNGEGKTTLINLMLENLAVDDGKIIKKRNLKIGYLEQNCDFESDNSVFFEMRKIFENVTLALDNLRSIQDKMSVLNHNSNEYRDLTNKYDSLLKFIEANDGYNIDVKIKTVLNGMGFEKNYDQQIKTMSGGEKTRLKLCKLLLEEPELLILDEPTNHLDIKTLFWLEDYLSAYKGAIFTVSHDRYFLDKLTEKTFEIENKTLSLFKGNYSKYKILKEEKNALYEKEYIKQQEEIKKLQTYIDINRVSATSAKSAQSRIKKLDSLEIIDKPLPPVAPPFFKFTYEVPSYEKVLSVKNLTLYGGDKMLFKDADLEIIRGDKIAICGDNGTGKSTFIKEIMFKNNPCIKLGRFVKCAYFDQETSNLDGENTVLNELWARFSYMSQTDIRKILAQKKLDEGDINKQVKSLSGGEKAKLALAVFETEHGNFLILDEPTNHLDLLARESLEKALKEYDGTLLFVSHDRYFIESLATKIVEIENQTFNIYDGDYNSFNALKKQKQAQTVKETAQPIIKEKTTYKSKEERANAVKTRLRIAEIEKKIAKIESEENLLNNEICLPEIAQNFAKLTARCNRLEEIKRELDALYSEYETLL